MNQFSIDLAPGQPGNRPGHLSAGDDRGMATSLRGNAMRPAWPFLVTVRPSAASQEPEQDSCSPSSFAS